MGYTSGSRKQPTYRAMGDHTEAFQVDFDPNVISYEKLCELFWRSHEPCSDAWSRQYRSALWYADEEQKNVAESTRAKLAERAPREIQTGIEPLGEFWVAEDYHQKYSLRHDPVLVDLLVEALGEDAILSSRSATKINALKARRIGLDAVRVVLQSEIDDESRVTRILDHLERGK